VPTAKRFTLIAIEVQDPDKSCRPKTMYAADSAKSLTVQQDRSELSVGLRSKPSMLVGLRTMRRIGQTGRGYQDVND